MGGDERGFVARLDDVVGYDFVEGEDGGAEGGARGVAVGEEEGFYCWEGRVSEGWRGGGTTYSRVVPTGDLCRVGACGVRSWGLCVLCGWVERLRSEGASE